MVYIGPVNTYSLTAKTKAVSGYSPEQDMPVSKAVQSTTKTAPVVDRRKAQDRRKDQRGNLVETRAGRDRRAAKKPHIDITV